MLLDESSRRHGVKLLAATAAIALAFPLIQFWPTQAAAQSNAARLVETKATTGNSIQPALTLRVPPPGTAFYETRRGDTVISVARHYLPQTSFLTSSELAQAIRASNSEVHGTFLKAGQELTIPGILDKPITEKS